MLFRTKFLFAFILLSALSIGSAALLIVTSHRNEVNHQRSNLAHESLSGYFQLTGKIFRTFKQTRRDLISGAGVFTFDFDQSAKDIADLLDQIDRILAAEAALTQNPSDDLIRARQAMLKTKVLQAVRDIQTASQMMRTGQLDAGRQKAMDVLQGQVDVEITILIESAITEERAELAQAQSKIRSVQQWTETRAWIMAALAVTLSTIIFITLLRRFQTGLRALDRGVKAYTANDLDYTIDLPGRDELSAVADRLTIMARQMQAKQSALLSARQDLELRITQRTADLSDANAELRKIDHQRRQFFADIGHELRTPVSAIRGEAEVALRMKTGRSAAQAAALKTIISISDELTALVDDLFLIAREMAGVLDFRQDQIDLNHAVSLGVEQVSSLLGRKEAVISLQLDQASPHILGNMTRVAQLVRILISNALEHTQHAVSIQVKTTLQDGHIVLSVADNGPGIAQKDWPHIFDRFVKGSHQTHGPSGTGLGLAIAKSIVVAHGATICVGHSNSGGAEFRVRLPCHSVRESK